MSEIKKEENEFDVKVPAPVATATVKTAVVDKKAKKQPVLKNVEGKDMKPEDYFYAEGDSKAVTPVSFNDVVGMPVTREDLIETFNNVFKPEDNVLFYKTIDKEVYIIIIPIKYSTTVGRMHESINGDFQKHAISFIAEGSVNLVTFQAKLKRILPFVNFVAR
jgi:hypothetical protein